MSTAIARNFQIGIDPTPSNNFTLYQPSTPDGTLRLGNGNTGITSSLLTLTSAGNFGLGVTPSAFTAGKAMEFAFAGNAMWGTGAGDFSMLANVRFNGALQYAHSGVGANRFVATGGAYQWFTAPSGTAGNAISFTQAMTLDASGNLALGGTTASSVISGSATVFQVSNGNLAAIALNHTGAKKYSISSQSNSSLVFYDETANAERARIDSSGNLLVGTTNMGTVGSTTGAGMSPGYVYAAVANDTPAIFSRRSGDGGIVSFRRDTTQVGTISVTTTSTAYNTSSDYRLKENIQPMTGALAKVTALKPCTYKWKADGSDGEGFIAHELAEVVPGCVTGEKDAVDKDGNPVYQGIDTSFLVATLTAAIQELKAEFDAYKATHP